jgi:hypothetical protein
MARFIIIVSTLFLGIASPVLADNSSSNSTSVHGGGLVCFTERLPQTPPAITCDQVCAATNAACASVEGSVTPNGCEQPRSGLARDAEQCRCCAIAR